MVVMKTRISNSVHSSHLLMHETHIIEADLPQYAHFEDRSSDMFVADSLIQFQMNHLFRKNTPP